MTPVEWTEAALDQLSDAYVAAVGPDRLDLVAATMAVNQTLGDLPDERGESRDGGYRVAFFGRLTVGFRPPPAGNRIAAVLVTAARWAPRTP